MSFLMRQVAHCDVCGHEWIVIAKKTPSHCASCKSRKWNKGDDGLPAAVVPKVKDVVFTPRVNRPKVSPRSGYVPPRYR